MASNGGATFCCDCALNDALNGENGYEKIRQGLDASLARPPHGSVRSGHREECQRCDVPPAHPAHFPRVDSRLVRPAVRPAFGRTAPDSRSEPIWCFDDKARCVVAHPARPTFRRNEPIAAAPRGRPQGTHAEADRYCDDPHHRRRPDHHRPGVRIRLFGHPGLQGFARRGLSHRPDQFQSRHDHDRSRYGGPHLYRADHAGDRRQDHRQGALRDSRRLRAAADDGRPDGAELRAVAEENGRARAIRRRDDRRDGRRRSTRPKTANCSARR